MGGPYRAQEFSAHGDVQRERKGMDQALPEAEAISSLWHEVSGVSHVMSGSWVQACMSGGQT